MQASIDNIKLLTCPFCGEQAILGNDVGVDPDNETFSEFITCVNGCVRTDYIFKSNTIDIVKTWNTRKGIVKHDK